MNVGISKIFKDNTENRARRYQIARFNNLGEKWKMTPDHFGDSTHSFFVWTQLFLEEWRGKNGCWKHYSG